MKMNELLPFFEAHQGSLSYQAFAPVYVWSDVFDLYWKISGERLLIFAQGDGDCFLITPPLGQGDAAGPANEALSIMRELNPNAASLRIQDADDALAAQLSDHGWRIRDSHVEYIYDRARRQSFRPEAPPLQPLRG